jgi:hypothetical protein
MSEVREELLNLWRDARGTSMFPNKEGEKLIDKTELAIKSEIRKLVEKLPTMQMNPTSDFYYVSLNDVLELFE